MKKIAKFIESMELEESIKMNLLFICICLVPIGLLLSIFLMFS